jgi:methylglyoxal synthase
MIFFSDPLETQSHDPDIKALLRLAIVWNIPIACNRASADFMISSPLMDGEYARLVPDYEAYRSRKLDTNGDAGQDSGDSAVEGDNQGNILLWEYDLDKERLLHDHS